ncbi:Chs5p [Malassezia vespertilionis]|uniref:Chs5p n=1 Tax=Malassezia vespertilionis TaxID=2020962 RepID=A0A2N1JCG4_9BASI|nr:Chs5p [Malassezia vespertilionis]
MSQHYVQKIAPALMQNPKSETNGNVNYTFTVGKLDAGIAILIGERASLIEFPSLLLPDGVKLGSVVDICVKRNETEEQNKREEFVSLQDDILQMYGLNSPTPPVLRLRNATQTTLSLEWDPLQLANAKLLSLDIVRNGQRIAKIPNPLSATSTKLSGLALNTKYTIQLVLCTSAGIFSSEELLTQTHTIYDLSGIHVCLGMIRDAALRDATKEVVQAIDAHWSDQLLIETTHLVCTEEPTRGAPDADMQRVYAKAQQLSIPMVQPHWVFAMVNIGSYYLDKIPPNAMRVKERIRKAKLHDELREEGREVATPETEAPLPPLPSEAEALSHEMDEEQSEAELPADSSAEHDALFGQ